MHIFVKTQVDDMILTIKAEPSDTIQKVKDKIQDQGKISTDKKRLAFAGKRLGDRGTLADNNIRDGDVIQLVS